MIQSISKTTSGDPAFDPAQRVLLSEGEAINAVGSGKAILTRYEPEEISIIVSADAPGYLVLFDTFYPGWEATVDGQPTPILRANLMFRAVSVMPGEHRVEFRYQPISLRIGARVSAAAWIVWGSLSVIAIRVWAQKSE